MGKKSKDKKAKKVKAEKQVPGIKKLKKKINARIADMIEHLGALSELVATMRESTEPGPWTVLVPAREFPGPTRKAYVVGSFDSYERAESFAKDAFEDPDRAAEGIAWMIVEHRSTFDFFAERMVTELEPAGASKDEEE